MPDAQLLQLPDRRRSAAGVAAWLALDSGRSVAEIDTARLRETLKKQGAAIF